MAHMSMQMFLRRPERRRCQLPCGTNRFMPGLALQGIATGPGLGKAW